MMNTSLPFDSPNPSPVSPLTPVPAGHGIAGATNAPIKRRAPIACRRCRRMRSKCLHDKEPPCKSCLEAGVPEECEFPARHGGDEDRQFRHPRLRADKRLKTEAIVRVKRESVSSPISGDALVKDKLRKYEDVQSLLPDLGTVREAINTFTRNFFQLGFIPKERFPQEIEQNLNADKVFLLLTILSIAARFNAKIQASYGTGQVAVDYFRKMAEVQALRAQERLIEEKPPTLELCQAFLLLSIAQQGSGCSNASYINMSIATGMAASMRLHREETYEHLTSGTTHEIDHVIRAESARRTFWVLHSQDNLHSGPYKPFSFAHSDITALLPCDEEDFKNARIPQSRAALNSYDSPGCPQCHPRPQQAQHVSSRPNSLFATLIQTHHLWGIVARRAVANEKSSASVNDSDFSQITHYLDQFESKLPREHTFGLRRLLSYRQNDQDLAFLGCTMGLLLCNIVLRKTYLDEMIQATRANPPDPRTVSYRQMSQRLVKDVRSLFEQVDAQYAQDRRPEERVGSQMATFCVYCCGLIAAYLYKFPHLDPQGDLDEVRREGRLMYERTIGMLSEAQAFWSLASAWLAGLRRWFEDPNTNRISFESGTMTDGRDPQPHALLHPPTPAPAWQNNVSNVFRTKPTPPQMKPPQHNTEPAILAPLQPTSMTAGHSENLSLPPISPSPHHQQTPQPPGPQPQFQTPQPLMGHNPHDGFYNVYSVPPQQQPLPQGHLMNMYPDTQAIDLQPIPFDDGFGHQLQQFMDPNWSTPNPAVGLYDYPPANMNQYMS